MTYRQYSPDEVDALAKAFLRRSVISCPSCGAALSDPKPGRIGTHFAPDVLVFHCRACDAIGEFRASDPEDSWSDEELRQIAEDHRRRNEATCPRDGCFIRITTPGQSIAWASYLCPYCGGHWTGDPSELRRE